MVLKFSWSACNENPHQVFVKQYTIKHFKVGKYLFVFTWEEADLGLLSNKVDRYIKITFYFGHVSLSSKHIHTT